MRLPRPQLPLIATMLVFAGLGFLLSDFLMVPLFDYDHGQGEGEACMLIGTLGGSLIGAVLHFLRSDRDLSQ